MAPAAPVGHHRRSPARLLERLRLGPPEHHVHQRPTFSQAQEMPIADEDMLVLPSIDLGTLEIPGGRLGACLDCDGPSARPSAQMSWSRQEEEEIDHRPPAPIPPWWTASGSRPIMFGQRCWRVGRRSLYNRASADMSPNRGVCTRPATRKATIAFLRCRGTLPRKRYGPPFASGRSSTIRTTAGRWRMTAGSGCYARPTRFFAILSAACSMTPMV